MGKRNDAERKTCEIEAELFFEGLTGSSSCVIRNLSDAGARIELSADTQTPRNFEVGIPVSAGVLDRRKVAVMWRCGDALGVRFKPR